MNEILWISMLIITSSIDLLLAGTIYGIGNIKVPKKSILTIGFISALIFSFACYIGSLFSNFIPIYYLKILSLVLLTTIGLLKLCHCFLIQKLDGFLKKKIKVTLFSFIFLITVYIDPKKADQDHSNILSPKEAIGTSFALSMDGIGVGIASGITASYLMITILLSFFITIVLFYFGILGGKTISKFSERDFSWCTGLFLIILAWIRFLF